MANTVRSFCKKLLLYCDSATADPIFLGTLAAFIRAERWKPDIGATLCQNILDDARV
jgi:hypothetical protein